MKRAKMTHLSYAMRSMSNQLIITRKYSGSSSILALKGEAPFTERPQSVSKDRKRFRTLIFPTLEPSENPNMSRKDELRISRNDSLNLQKQSKTANRALALAELKKRREERYKRVESLSRSNSSSSSGSLSPPATMSGRLPLEGDKGHVDTAQASESTFTRRHHANARHGSVPSTLASIPYR